MVLRIWTTFCQKPALNSQWWMRNLDIGINYCTYTQVVRLVYPKQPSYQIQGIYSSFILLQFVYNFYDLFCTFFLFINRYSFKFYLPLTQVSCFLLLLDLISYSWLLSHTCRSAFTHLKNRLNKDLSTIQLQIMAQTILFLWLVLYFDSLLNHLLIFCTQIKLYVQINNRFLTEINLIILYP